MFIVVYIQVVEDFLTTILDNVQETAQYGIYIVTS